MRRILCIQAPGGFQRVKRSLSLRTPGEYDHLADETTFRQSLGGVCTPELYSSVLSVCQCPCVIPNMCVHVSHVLCLCAVCMFSVCCPVCCPCVVRALSVCCPCVVRVLSVCCPGVLSVCCMCAVRVLSVYCPCVIHVLSVCCPCAVRVLSVRCPYVVRVVSVWCP